MHGVAAGLGAGMLFKKGAKGGKSRSYSSSLQLSPPSHIKVLEAALLKAKRKQSIQGGASGAKAQPAQRATGGSAGKAGSAHTVAGGLRPRSDESRKRMRAIASAAYEGDGVGSSQDPTCVPSGDEGSEGSESDADDGTEISDEPDVKPTRVAQKPAARKRAEGKVSGGLLGRANAGRLG